MHQESDEDQTDKPSYEQQNELFDALGSHRNRYVLYACLQSTEPLSISAVANQVAAWEYDKPLSEVTSEEHKRVYTALQQYQLSKLERANLIEIDNMHIECTDRARNLDLHIELVSESDVPWSGFYLGLSVISGALFGLKVLGVLPDQISYPVLAVGILLAYLCSAVVHYWTSSQVHFGPVDRTLEIDE